MPFFKNYYCISNCSILPTFQRQVKFVAAVLSNHNNHLCNCSCLHSPTWECFWSDWLKAGLFHLNIISSYLHKGTRLLNFSGSCMNKIILFYNKIISKFHLIWESVIIKFATLDNAFCVLWLVQSILVISSYTLVWPYMVNDCAKHCWAKNVFARKRKFTLNNAKKMKKKFCGQFGSMPTFRSMQKGKKCLLWWGYVFLTTRCYTTSNLQVCFFDFAQIFSLVFRTSDVWSLRNLIKQLFHSYETGYSQLGATCLVGYLQSQIQCTLMELLLINWMI